MIIAPSMLAADLADLRGALAACEAAGCELIHFDIMDGHFVPNLSFGPPVVRAARAHSSLAFDVHLMVSDPAPYVEPLCGLDLRLLSFQIETTHFAPRLLSLIHMHGMGPSVVLNPQTPVSSLSDVLHLVDNVLIMSVDPGFGGQCFIERSWDKLAELAARREELRARGHDFTIEVDGGVNGDNLQRLKAAGVDIAVMGSAFFHASSAQQADFVKSAAQ